jgi:hypothetical protein
MTDPKMTNLKMTTENDPQVTNDYYRSRMTMTDDSEMPWAE